jgi:hypothetical protein
MWDHSVDAQNKGHTATDSLDAGAMASDRSWVEMENGSCRGAAVLDDQNDPQMCSGTDSLRKRGG